MSAEENRVDIIQNMVLHGTNVTIIKPVDINLRHQFQPANYTGSFYQAVFDRISSVQRNWIDYPQLLTIQQLNKDPTDRSTFFRVFIEERFLEFWMGLPKAFLEVHGSINYRSQRLQDNFVERLELTDILDAVNSTGSADVLTHEFSVDTRHAERSSSGGVCAFNLIIGWQEPVSNAIKISTVSIIQNLFENEDTKDLSIVAGNGATIKCHKIIFAAQSSVLSKMVTNRMKESTTGRVELKENSEEGIKLLLLYLYGLELTIETLSCDLVVELLKTSHEYDLAHLQNSLLELLLQKDMGWFTLDAILELYFYAMNVNDFATLRDHSLRIMSKVNFEELCSCEVFQSLDRSQERQLFCKLLEI